MKILVQVTQEELEEMEVGEQDLLRNVLEDLDNARSYSGFSVDVEVVESHE
ncbi:MULTISPECIES: hypothetical protein [unclassified Pantoea]|uniref:hypothetical protein n=1 Tax=unclassified Pantoea TaxID=2630326 RepID=UPI001CD47AA7|nr:MULTISPECIES: hypothetical protein [unclassified Pantoea]MCA1178911.1 hypothetical protein [Pantoea sp. alder69]MCA1253776.1 hypothetical protein [Pantoea sp. alder70]MCA1267400.1 hypothetical protein [Pantoea sp. alder81]